jgi:hypothetical protein
MAPPSLKSPVMRRPSILTHLPWSGMAVGAALFVVGMLAISTGVVALPGSTEASPPTHMTGTVTPTPPATGSSLAVIPVATPEPTVRCPSQSEAADELGAPVEQLASEPFCAFTWKYDGSTHSVACPTQWECEIAPPVEHVVFLEYGPVGPRAAVAGTWRYLPTYPSKDVVQDECATFARVETNATTSGWTAQTYPNAC